MSHFALLLVPAAASPSPSPSSNVPDDSIVSPGLLGFLFLVFLAVAVYIIWRSMNTQLKRVDFDEDTVNGDVAPSAERPAPEPAPGAGSEQASGDTTSG